MRNFNSSFPLLLLLGIIGSFFNAVSAQIKLDYAILVAAYDRAVPLSQFNGLNVMHRVEYGQIHSYYVTGFKDKAAAEAALPGIVQKGFKDARIENLGEDGMYCCAKQPIAELQKIRNIFFDFDKAALKPESIQQLNLLAKIMKETPSYTVEVHAHTDAKGNNEYNQNLSLRRENAAINYLIKKGIAASRISGHKHGEEAPIAKNEINGADTPEGRQFNRRVVLIVKEGANVLNIVEEIQIPTSLKQ